MPEDIGSLAGGASAMQQAAPRKKLKKQGDYWVDEDTGQQFLDEVINPFNARMSEPLVPDVRGIYADGDIVIIFFDASATAKDGVPYRNTYTWYFQMRAGKVIKAIAFFDTRDFDELWTRVSPSL